MPFQRKNETKKTYEIVDRWARWARNGSSGCQGWSSTSASYRLAEQQRTGVRYEPGFQSNWMDPETAAVDRVVTGLPDPLKGVLMAEFFTYGVIEVRAANVGLGKRRFAELLDSALLVVGARLANAIDAAHETR